jgi:hypothetical protein
MNIDKSLSMETTWRSLLEEAFKQRGDDFSKMIVTLSNYELDLEFYDGFGSTEGIPFTAWGENYVYFPICYDGSEWVGSAPRNPCDEISEHQGG